MSAIQGDATDKSVSDPNQQEGTPDLAIPQHRSYLHSLPSELFDLILSYLKRSNIIALGQSCTALYHMLLRNVYQEVVVGHGAAKTVRAAHRLLTIKQKRRLAAESTFRYQQKERYCTGFNDDIKPKCTEFVRKLHIRMPPKRFGHTVTRYIEEILQNLDNVEIISTSLISPYIARWISTQKKLKALFLDSPYTTDPSDGDLLSAVSNLEHLNMWEPRYWFRYTGLHSETLETIIRNSASTLQSLRTRPLILENIGSSLEGEMRLAAAATTTEKTMFSVLESLSIAPVTDVECEISPNQVKMMQRVIGFDKLKELIVSGFKDDSRFFRQISASNLRHLWVSLSPVPCPEKAKVRLESRCSFLSSFGSLETLVLDSYGNHKENLIASNHKFADIIVEAIRKHSKLRILRITSQMENSFDVPLMGAEAVKSMIAGLPNLRVLQFAPDCNEIVEISQALVHGRNLESIECWDNRRWMGTGYIEYGVDASPVIVKTFLNHSSRPRWEDEYRLKSVQCYRGFEISSSFPTNNSKWLYGSFEMASDDGTRLVQCRAVPWVDSKRKVDLWVEKIGGLS